VSNFGSKTCEWYRDLLKAAGKSGRYHLRDEVAVMLAYRHGLRASELVGLQWAQIDLKGATIVIRRAKGGMTTEHPLRSIELRLLGKLHREYPESAYVLMSERGTPWSSRPSVTRCSPRRASRIFSETSRCLASSRRRMQPRVKAIAEIDLLVEAQAAVWARPGLLGLLQEVTSDGDGAAISEAAERPFTSRARDSRCADVHEAGEDNEGCRCDPCVTRSRSPYGYARGKDRHHDPVVPPRPNIEILPQRHAVRLCDRRLRRAAKWLTEWAAPASSACVLRECAFAAIARDRL